MKESFILYTKQYKAIKALTLSQKGRLLDALFQYAIDGQMPTIKDEVVRVSFDFMRIQIDLDADKYTAKCQRNKEIALERERKRKEHERTRTYTNVHERTHNDNDNDNDNSKELISNTQKKEEKKAHARYFEIEEHIQDYKRPTDEESKRMGDVIRMFNEEVKLSGSQIQSVRVLTPQRVLRLRRIFLDYTDPQIRLAFQHATRSAYLNGKTKDRRRPADFDWLIKYDNFTRLFEGAI